MRAEGSKIWSFETGDSVNCAPIAINGIVYSGSEDSYVYAINATTGRQIWSCKTGGEVESFPSIANGVLYIGSGDNNIYAFGSISSPQPSTPLSTARPSDSVNQTPITAMDGYVLVVVAVTLSVVLAVGLMVVLRRKKPI